MALEIREKELEAQAKYTAELRSYISSLHEKIRSINEDRKHHEAKHNEYKLKLEEVNRKSSFDMQREKQILDRRVSALYNALEQIEEIVEEVI
jgi:septal ring factor EnvC (AmiA/AmiB activator)